MLCLACIRASYAEITIDDDEPCDAPDWRIRRLFVDAEKEIRQALEVVGYYDAQIVKQLEAGNTCWQAGFVITPGQPVVLRNVSIEIDTGNTLDGELVNVVQQCNLKSGDVLQHASYDRCKRTIAREAKDRGYFAAGFIEQRIDVYPGEYSADITLHFYTGRRYVFGEVSFDQAVLNVDKVERFVRVKAGDPYDAKLVRQMQRDLIASAYFDQVSLSRTPRGDPYYDVPIHIELTPGKKYQYNAGIGYATDLGPKLRFGVLNRRVNTDGHQIEFEANLSKVISEADTSYKVEDNDSYDSNLFSAGIQRLQEQNNGWIRTLFLNLRLEDYQAGSVDDGYSKLLTPGIGYAFIEEDYPPRPLEGHRSNVQARAAIEGLISDTSFAQLFGDTKWVFGLWSGGRVLTRAEAGFTLIDELDTLPASVRFFAGGDTSVRGYAYKSLGPTDPFGAVIGGENLLVGSIEFDQIFAKDWSVAAFIDSGNAYDRLSDFNTATGVGVGIRWYSPLGPIRVDVAFPLEDNAPDDYRFHITLGPDL